MAAELVASLVLKLEDQLGGGLQRLQEQLDRLSVLGKALGLPGLDKAKGDALGLAKQIGEVSSQIYRMQQATREGTAGFESMGRMARSVMDGIGSATAGLRERISTIGGRAHAFGEAGSNLINRGMGAAAEGFAVYEPIKEYAERDKLLRSIAIMEGKSGPGLGAEISRLNTLVNRDALKNALSSESVAEAYKDLLGQGLPRDKIDQIIGAHSAAAQAYGIPAEILGPVTGALVGNMKIGANEKDTGAALAAIAKASQGGRFKMEDFARELPGLTGVSASLGMTGRGSLNELAAGLEISTKTASDPAQAGVNFHDLLAYITSNREDNLTRKKLGIDMPALLLKGEKRGQNPLDVYLDEIRKITAGKSPVAQAQAISSVVTNQQARNALLALVQHYDEFRGLQKNFGNVGAGKLAQDNASAIASPSAQLAKMQENFLQLGLTMGQAFMPVLTKINAGLSWLNEKLTWLNEHFPTTTSYVLGSIAVMLALGAALTLLGGILAVFVAGFALLGSVLGGVGEVVAFVITGVRFLLFLFASLAGISVGAAAAITLLAAILAGVVIDIYENWGRFRGFFEALWNGVKQIFSGFVTFVAGVFTGNLSKALAGLSGMGAGIGGAWRAVWNIVKQVFNDFAAWADGWTGGLVSRIISAIGAGIGHIHAILSNLSPAALAGEAVHGFDNSGVGRWLGLGDHPALQPASGAKASTGSATAPPTQRVDIHLHAEPGTSATATSSSDQVSVTAPPRGATTSRP